MNRRRGILMLVAGALACVSCASWSAAELIAGRDYFSVQLRSGKSAAALQESLARLADQPYARIDKRGDVYILRVGFWSSREEAVRAAQALQPNFRGAFARIASYRPDSIVAGAGQQPPGTSAEPFPATAARPPPRVEVSPGEQPYTTSSVPSPGTAAVPPPGTGSTPSQSQVLILQREAQPNLLPDPELQGVPPPAPPPSPPPSTAADERPGAPTQPSRRRGPDEEPLWKQLRDERYAELDTEIARLRRAYPLWRPPARLLALRRQGEARRRITEAIDKKEWNDVLAFSRQYPGLFSCENPGFMLGLAEAYYSQGDTARSIGVAERIIPACPNPIDRINALQRVNALFTLEIMEQLLQRELQGGRRDSVQQAQLERLIYDFQLRGLVEAVAIKDRARAMEIIETIDRMPYAQRNPRHANQVGWIQLESGQDEAAIKRFDAALSWEPDIELAEDLRRGLALAYFRLSQRDDPEAAKLHLKRLDAAEAALARTSPDDARTRDLLGEIFLLRATDAFERKDYGLSLAYLDQAEALGRSGRDVAMRRAWVHFQLGDDAKAAELFISLYRDKPEREIAEGVVFSLSRGGRWDRLAQLAQSLGGPLTELAEDANAQRYYDGKLFLTAEYSMPEHFPVLHNIASSSVASGAMARYKAGADGSSRLSALRAPVLEGVTVFDGVHELRLQVDRVDLASGDLPAFAMIGSFPAAGAYVVAPTTKLTNSFEPSFSYRHQGPLTTYAGLGLTPTGGVISSAPVGNLGFVQQLGRGSWGAELFSEPVRETILSYTGIVDPYTGQSWGRVRRSGILVRGYTATERWNVTGGLQAAHLGGENVANNQSLKLNLGMATNLASRDSDLLPALDYLTVGPNFSYESYRKNLGQFTLGHGGYFSPQRVIMLGVTGQFLTQEARQQMIRGSVSAGRFKMNSAASPCFPLGAVLPLNPGCVDGYTASSGTGNSYSVEAMWVRRLSNYLQLGGAVIWRRSPQYNDSSSLIFLRYLFDPRPVVMSSDLPEQVFQRLF